VWLFFRIRSKSTNWRCIGSCMRHILRFHTMRGDDLPSSERQVCSAINTASVV
jgi:hypothetical protein